jgi:hypothetical protein
MIWKDWSTQGGGLAADFIAIDLKALDIGGKDEFQEGGKQLYLLAFH